MFVLCVSELQCYLWGNHRWSLTQPGSWKDSHLWTLWWWKLASYLYHQTNCEKQERTTLALIQEKLGRKDRVTSLGAVERWNSTKQGWIIWLISTRKMYLEISDVAWFYFWLIVLSIQIFFMCICVGIYCSMKAKNNFIKVLFFLWKVFLQYNVLL